MGVVVAVGGGARVVTGTTVVGGSVTTVVTGVGRGPFRILKYVELVTC